MEWYYANDGQRQGPVSIEDFSRHVATGVVRDDTLVWHAGMSNWQTWREVAPTVELPIPEPLPPPVPDEHVATPVGAFAAHEVPMQYGGFWIRLLAKLIDGIVLFVVGNIIGALFFGDAITTLESLDPNDPASFGPIMAIFGQLMLMGLIVGLAYHWFFLAKFAATPGKLALGLRIVRGDGSPLSHGRIVARFFAEYVSGFVLYIGYIIAAFDNEKRTLHDYICDTRVVKK